MSRKRVRRSRKGSSTGVDVENQLDRVSLELVKFNQMLGQLTQEMGLAGERDAAHAIGRAWQRSKNKLFDELQDFEKILIRYR